MSDHFAFLSQNTFLKAPVASTQQFVVAGIAWDGATTNRPGSRFGPREIRNASHMLCDGTHPFFDVDLQGVLGDAGDLPLPNTSLPAMRTALEKLVPPLIDRFHMAWLGGDHSITLSLLRCYRKKFGRPLALLHFDAHCDTWTDHFGEPSGHGTWVSEAVTEGLIDPKHTVQIGIRSAAVKEARDFIKDHGGRVVAARELRGLESAAQLGPLLADVRARIAPAGAPPLYLSLDIDCLDPAFAPGTGTPEPGGLSTNQVLSIIETLADLPFVGMDCVEVAPPYDHSELTSNAASTLVWTYLCGQRHRIDAAAKPAAAVSK